MSIDIATLHVFSHLHPQPITGSWRRRRQIQKLPPPIRQRSEQAYDPVMVSIGPYHHGKPELRRAEEFKLLCLDRRAGGDEQKKAHLYSNILDKIEAIRDCYAEAAVVDRYDDGSLALMMLLDATIIVDFIHSFLGVKGGGFVAWHRSLGATSGPSMIRDMMVVENQIPFQVLEMLITLLYEEDEEEAALFLPRFLSQKTGMKVENILKIQENEEDPPPLHFLEAIWRVLVSKSLNNDNKFLLSGLSMREDNDDHDVAYCYTHHSVTDLKAKGIRFHPNPIRLLVHIAFTAPTNGCFGHLHLPVQYVSDLTYVSWSNMIAFEVLPDGPTSLVMLSYAIFMKSLIQSTEDVRELQESGILLNRLANLDKVVEMFKEIETFGLHDLDVFKGVRRRIEEHCKSRARTWIAELVYTRFRTPWTAIAFFAALLLLCLTFLQTFFTIRR